MSNKREVTFYATNERKPVVLGGSVNLPDGGKIEFKSKNEYKAWRKRAKADIRRARTFENRGF